MKKYVTIFMAASVMWLMTFQTACIGSFNMFKGVLEWNRGMAKWLDELVFILMWVVPVYEIALIIDAIALNLIEFWTGSNPMAMNEGEIEQQVVMGKDGNTYKISATKNRFDIIQLSGSKAGEIQSLVFNPNIKSWSHEKGCKQIKFMQYSEDGRTLSVLTTDGRIASIPSGMSNKSLASKMIKEQLDNQLCVN